MRLVRILYLLCLAVLAGWHFPSTALAGGEEARPTPDINVIEFLGNVVYVPMESGFYGIVSDTGKRYLPLDLPEEFRQEGLRVRVTAKLNTKMLGIHMWGQYIEIIAIVPTECLAGGVVRKNCKVSRP